MCCLSVGPLVTTQLPLDGFSWSLFIVFSFFFFFKSVDKIQASWIYCRSNGYFTWLPISIFDHISLISSLNEKCFSQKFVEKIKRHIFCSITCCTENHAIYDIMWNILWIQTGTSDKRVHDICMPDTKGYRHTLRIYNSYFYSSASVVSWKCPNVILYVCFHSYKHLNSRYISQFWCWNLMSEVI